MNNILLIILPLLGFIIMRVLIYRLRNTEGWLSKRIKNSDYHAWKMAVEEKKKELEELKKHKPRR